MKISVIQHILLSTVLVTITSCSSNDQYLESQIDTDNLYQNNYLNNFNNKKLRISDAIAIADSCLKKTRGYGGQPQIDYVVNKQASCGNDTLAYIINYNDESGFAIIATDSIKKPVLAYSDSGSFSLDCEPANLYFIQNIKEYVNKELEESSEVVPKYVITTHHLVEPVIKIHLHQGYPFNSVVNLHHPGCKAGCVPLASVLIMSHAKNSLVYNNYYYDFKTIREAMLAGPGYGSVTNLNEINTNPGYIGFMATYEGSINAMAQIISDIGQDLDAKYGQDVTLASMNKAREAIANAGYTVTERSMYNPENMINYLENDYIYLQDGTKPEGRHCWVIDGCEYDLTPDGTILNPYFHCHWGEGGYSDGFFTGAVFMYNPTSLYIVEDNFAVKIEI